MKDSFSRLYPYLRVEFDERFAVVTIDREASLNALNSEVLNSLQEFVQDVSKQNSIKVVVVTGAGNKAFVAGADISEMASMSAEEARRFCSVGNQLMDELEESGCIFIAAINGYALGGGLELALACDLRIASSNARFGLPEVNLGIIPGFGGVGRLSAAVGPARAEEMLLTGRQVGASEALQMGLIHEVVDEGKALERSLQRARELSAKSSNSLESLKRLGKTMQRRLWEETRSDQENFFVRCFELGHAREGLTSFLEKRHPRF